MQIRQQGKSDLEEILRIQTLAFGYDKEAELVRSMLSDPSAKPDLSLLAIDPNEHPVGHILFTRVRVPDLEGNVSASILAPLAVIPDYQKKGVGGALVKEGLRLLKQADVQLVFVLGHPGYYPQFGFEPAGKLGFDAPYPIPDEHAGAWMMQSLQTGVPEARGVKVVCCTALNKPEHWRE